MPALAWIHRTLPHILISKTTMIFHAAGSTCLMTKAWAKIQKFAPAYKHTLILAHSSTSASTRLNKHYCFCCYRYNLPLDTGLSESDEWNLSKLPLLKRKTAAALRSIRTQVGMTPPPVCMSFSLSACVSVYLHPRMYALIYMRVLWTPTCGFRLPYTQASNAPLRAVTAQHMALNDFTRGVLEAREKGLPEVKDWNALMPSYFITRKST
jgi:hypothetical protein